MIRHYVATRPFYGQTVNGDAWVVIETERGPRVALIDGAGHGPLARMAADLAITSLQETRERSLRDALRSCHEVLHSSRGAVLSILQFSEDVVEFGGVGNVEGRLFVSGRNQHLAPDRGLLGAALPTVRPQTFPLSENWAVLLFSDGVSQRSGIEFDPRSSPNSPQDFVDGGLQSWGRTTEDATLMLILPGSSL